MQLRSRLFSILMVVLIVYIGFHYLIQSRLIIPNLLALERSEAAADLERCLAALQREIHHLDHFTNDWAAWDDTYDFVQSRDRGYIASNLGVQTFRDNHLALIIFVDAKGRRVWSGDFDPVTDSLRSPTRLDIGPPTIAQARPRKQGPDETRHGIVTTPQGPLLLAARAILTSDRRGPQRGLLIMGRHLTPDLVAELNAQTRVPHEIWSLSGKDLPASEKKILERLPAGTPLFQPEDTQMLAVYATVPDLAGRPALLVKARRPRRIFTKTVSVERISLASDLALGVILLAVLGAAINTIVLRPLNRLTRQAVHIRETNDLSLRSGLGGSDEIGHLAQEFDRLLDRLQQLYEGLEERVDRRTADLTAVNARLQGEIRERKRAEATLRETRDSLEETVAARTAELSRVNAQLRQAIARRREGDQKLQEYHSNLRKLSSRLVLAEERERRRVANLLHDHIGQSLTVAKLNFDALAASLPEAATQCRTISDQLADTIQAVRTLTFEISPPILYDFGLEAALGWLAEQIQEKHGLKVAFEDGDEPSALDDAQRVLLFQAARELLLNIVKHAGARHATVTIDCRDGHIRLVFEDDGRGFDPAEVRRKTHQNGTFGLFSIRERLRNTGGRMEIDSGPGRGTRITIVSPLQAAPPPTIEGLIK